MKKIATKVLYVFSFSLLFVALYLNFVSKDTTDASLRQGKKVTMSNTVISENSAVAQPENNTVLK
jgi:hypothetical protein